MTGEQICRALDDLARQGAGMGLILSGAVERLHASNPRFHWTGIYELFPNNVRRGDAIFGQIDIDSHELNAFDPATVEEVERVADYLAGAYAGRRKSSRAGGRPVRP